MTTTRYRCWDESLIRVDIEAESPSEAAREYVDEGDWDRSVVSWHDVYVACLAEDGSCSDEAEADAAIISIQLDAEEPECWRGRDHSWRGISTRGSGGGVIVRDRCTHCGRERVTDTWASRPDTGEQGFHVVDYPEPEEVQP